MKKYIFKIFIFAVIIILVSFMTMFFVTMRRPWYTAYSIGHNTGKIAILKRDVPFFPNMYIAHSAIWAFISKLHGFGKVESWVFDMNTNKLEKKNWQLSHFDIHQNAYVIPKSLEFVVFEKYFNGEKQISRAKFFSQDGGDPETIDLGDGFPQAVISDDGKWLAFTLTYLKGEESEIANVKRDIKDKGIVEMAREGLNLPFSYTTYIMNSEDRTIRPAQGLEIKNSARTSSVIGDEAFFYETEDNKVKSYDINDGRIRTVLSGVAFYGISSNKEFAIAANIPVRKIEHSEGTRLSQKSDITIYSLNTNESKVISSKEITNGRLYFSPNAERVLLLKTVHDHTAGKRFPFKYNITVWDVVGNLILEKKLNDFYSMTNIDGWLSDNIFFTDVNPVKSIIGLESLEYMTNDSLFVNIDNGKYELASDIVKNNGSKFYKHKN